jgi:hypothetical protein
MNPSVQKRKNNGRKSKREGGEVNLSMLAISIVICVGVIGFIIGVLSETIWRETKWHKREESFLHKYGWIIIICIAILTVATAVFFPK